MSKKRTKTKLRIGDKVWIDDEDDSGEYEITIINVPEDDCWLTAEIKNSGDKYSRTVEQQFPLSWIEDMFSSQNSEEWETRKASVPKD